MTNYLRIIVSVLVVFLLPFGTAIAMGDKVLKLKNSTGGPLKVFVTYIGEPIKEKEYMGCSDCKNAPRLWEQKQWVELKNTEEISWDFNQDICVSAWNEDQQFFKTGKYLKFPTHSEAPTEITWLVYPSEDGVRKANYRNASNEHQTLEGDDFGTLQGMLRHFGIIEKKNYACRYTSYSTSIELGAGRNGMKEKRAASEMGVLSISTTEKIEVVNGSPKPIEIAYTESKVWDEISATLMTGAGGGGFESEDQRIFRIDYKGWIKLQPNESHVVERTFSDSTLQRGVCVAARMEGADYDALGLTAREGPRYHSDFIFNGYFEAASIWADNVFHHYEAYLNDPSKRFTMVTTDVAAAEDRLRADHNLDMRKFYCRTYDTTSTIFIE